MSQSDLLRELERNRGHLTDRELALLELGKTSIEGFTQLVGKIIEGAFNAGAAILQSPPPSQIFAASAGMVALSWFCEAYPHLSKFFHIDILCERIGGVVATITGEKSIQELTPIQLAAQECKAKLQAAGIDDPVFYADLDTLILTTDVLKWTRVLQSLTGIAFITDWIIGTISTESVVAQIRKRCDTRLAQG